MGRAISHASADCDERQLPHAATGAPGLSAIHVIAKEVEVGLLDLVLAASHISLCHNKQIAWSLPSSAKKLSGQQIS